ncbi:MAG: L-serine ammonia-lyase, iron-sulfur-dependent, subunit alpha [Clostridia bacterium]|nr:L-serine ammonia-lyase, iron-sulfur-dependent, subunit alpha [Clostridia bacterium]
MSNTISEKIRSIRIDNGISQRELARIMGISNRAVSKWENGLSYPSTENLIRISEIFSIPLEYFFEKAKEENEKLADSKPSGMESLSELYKIGLGPSSSHTMGPEKACQLFKDRNDTADSFKVILYGSLSKTGKGHGTDVVIEKTLAPKNVEIIFDNSVPVVSLPHPNTMDIFAIKNGRKSDSVRVMSVGGGSIVFENFENPVPPLIYPETTFREIADYCRKNKLRLWQYVEMREGEGFSQHMANIWETMKDSINRGLDDEGELPGGLGVVKKAKTLFDSQHIDESAETRENRIVCSYAFAVSEQNASYGKVVTAPTCGASGVVPACLYYQQQKHGYSDVQIIRALETAGVIGNLIKSNASISGAKHGCQAEIGTACAMAAAALAELFGLNLDKIEYAAEIAIEHHLGLTCDPICGLVQIPCIERNAVAAMRAINAVSLANFLSNTRKISLDKVIIAMKETGRDIARQYKETGEGGLANIGI